MECWSGGWWIDGVTEKWSKGMLGKAQRRIAEVKACWLCSQAQGLLTRPHNYSIAPSFHKSINPLIH